MIGLSAMTFQFNTAWRIVEFIKSLHRDIKIAIGGYHATLMYEEIASSDNGKPFDYIVRGEGEKTFGDMLDAIEGKQKWEDISGLSYRRNGGFYTIHQDRWKILKPCSSRAGTHACGMATFFPGKNWIWLKPLAAAL